MSEKLQVISDMVDIKVALAGMSVETNDFENEIDMKDVNCTNENSESGSTKSSRELKSILALSKEANLNTNIIHKRKSTDSLGKIFEKSEHSFKDLSITEMVDMHSQMRSIIRGDYNKLDSNISEMFETSDGNSNSKIFPHHLEDVDNTADLEDPLVYFGEKSTRNNSSNVVIVINNKKKDPFCWKCHHEKPTFYCESCPRSFHQKCLKLNEIQSDHWICPVCTDILKAETLKQRSPPMQELDLEHFCGLLKFAIRRMMQIEGYEPFLIPVNEMDFPDYKKYVAQPQDLSCLEKNIKANIYSSTQAFEADAQWILHNSIIFNSYQSKLTSIAKSMMKICKQEMSEIENCANCYLNANTKKKTWFVEVCPKPHMVVWAKLKGFPYWPAKAMRTNSCGLVDVRFFGAHDRAWVPYKDCFLYCLQDPNSNKQKRNDINESIKELDIYIENLRHIYGEFCYAPYKVIIEPDQEPKQLKMLLPRYDPDKNNKPGRDYPKSLYRNGNCSPDLDNQENDDEDGFLNVDENLAENSEHNLQSNHNCDSGSDDSPNTNNLTGHNYNGTTEDISKTSPVRKRQICEAGDYAPAKLSRHDSSESISHSDSDASEACSETIEMEDLNPINENCLKLTDETKTNTKSSSESGTKSVLSDILLKTLADLIDEKPEKEKIVSETDLLLDSITNEINSVLQKPTELPVRIDKMNNISECVLSTTSTKSTDTVGTVEVIEVHVTESPEPAEHMELELPINIQDVVQATDISTVSISPIEPEDTPVSKNVQQPAEKVFETAIVDNMEPLEEDEEEEEEEDEDEEEEEEEDCVQSTPTRNTVLPEHNLHSCSSSEDYTNPLDFVEVTESIPLEDKDAIEEEMPITEKSKDILDMLTQTSREFDEQTTHVEPQHGNKRMRSSGDIIETINKDENIQPRKSLKLVNIDDIRNKVLDNPTSQPTMSVNTTSLSSAENKTAFNTEPLKSLKSLLGKQLQAFNKKSSDIENVETVVIKSEPNSEDEQDDDEKYMEMKRTYLSALNISEKVPQPPKKPVSMRTRSKSEENKIKLFTTVHKVIDDSPARIRVNNENNNSRNVPPKRKEIFVKPLSKMQVPKQKARKSFPMPIRNVYTGPLQKKDIRITKPIAPAPTPNIAPLRTASLLKSSEAYTSCNNFVYITHPSSGTNTVTVLPPNQPITYSANRGNPIFTMMHPNNYTTLTSTSNRTTSDCFESQNYIPQSGEILKLRNNSTRVTLSTVPENNIATTVKQVTSTVTQLTPTVTSSVSAVSGTASTASTASNVTNEFLEGLGTMSSLMPDTVNKTISEILCRAPPRLKRRPPGPLSANFDEGLPSSSGAITSAVNSISHRLTDYFRGMLLELLCELSTTGHAEAEIAKLKLENEELKYRHGEEIVEIKKNISSILLDVQKTIEDERTRAIEETRSACDAETVQRIEEAKSKQWCSNCFKEAQFYCCWNTSYCDFPCQEKHWSKHMSNCTQNIQTSRLSQPSVNTIATHTPISRSSQSSVNSTSTHTPIIRPTQPLVLRQTSAPKQFTQKTLIAKPTKVFVNRSNSAKNAIGYMRTSSGSHITLLESPSGNYELLGSNGGPISVGGKFITGLGKIRNSNVISVPSSVTGPSTSASIMGNPQVSLILSQPKSMPLLPTTTIISDDEE